MKKLLLIFIIAAGAIAAGAQTPTPTPPPEEKVCISQDAAQECAACVRERKELRELAKANEEARAEDARIIKDLEIRLAAETQKNIDAEAERLRLMKIVEFLLVNGRKKQKFGLIVF